MKVKIEWYLPCVMLACLIVVSITFGSIYFYNVKLDVEVLDRIPSPKKIKAMLLVDGAYNDQGWSQAHVDAFIEAIDQLQVIGEIHDNVQGDECYNFIKHFVEQGGDVIVAPSAKYNQCLNESVAKYPSIKFLGIIDPKLAPSPNLLTFFAKAYQVRYLTGIIAASISDSDSFGFFVATKTPESVRAINAYALGLRSVNPHAKLYVIDFNTWDAKDLEVPALDYLFEVHPDIKVLSYHMTSHYIDQYCDIMGLKCISYNISKSDNYPLSNLTSIDWNWGGFYKIILSRIINNSFEPGELLLSLRFGTVRLGHVNRMLSFVNTSLVDHKMSDFLQNKKDVFDGPLFDNQGKLRVPLGGTVSRSDLLYNIDWYVDGVEEVPYENAK